MPSTPSARRRRATDPVARGCRPRRDRRRATARRLRLRRLPSSGRHRTVLARDARRVGVRGGRRARARDLQRLPGAGRGRARAGRAVAQSGPSIRVPSDRHRTGTPRHAVHAPGAGAPTAPDARRARRGLLLRRRRDARRAGARRSGPLPLRHRGRAPGTRRRPREPQRLAPGDRRRDERPGQRRRADAASRDRGRAHPRLGRRPPAHPVVRRERRGRVGAAAREPAVVGAR